ncbi:unnamed protein product, partial [Amoebophrya sp. A25]
GFGDRLGYYLSIAALAKTLTQQSSQHRVQNFTVEEGERTPEVPDDVGGGASREIEYKAVSFWAGGLWMPTVGHSYNITATRRKGRHLAFPLFDADSFFSLVERVPDELILLKNRVEFLKFFDRYNKREKSRSTTSTRGVEEMSINNQHLWSSTTTGACEVGYIDLFAQQKEMTRKEDLPKEMKSPEDNESFKCRRSTRTRSSTEAISTSCEDESERTQTMQMRIKKWIAEY